MGWLAKALVESTPADESIDEHTPAMPAEEFASLGSEHAFDGEGERCAPNLSMDEYRESIAEYEEILRS